MGLYEEIIKENKKYKNQKNAFKMPENKSVETIYKEHESNFKTAKKNYEETLNKEYTRLGGSQNTGLIMPKKVETNAFLKADKKKKQNSLIEDLMIKQKAHDNYDVTVKADKFAEAANKYIYAQYLHDQYKVDNEKTNFWDKTLGVPVRAIGDLFSSAGAYVDENGKDVYLPSYNELKQEKVRGDYSTPVGRFLSDVAYNTTKIAGAEAMNTLLPGSGSAVYWTDMFMDNYKKSVNQGYDSGSATAYALVNLGFEYGTGKLLGGATGKLTKGSSKQLDNALGNAAYKLTKNPKVSRILGTAGSEGTEEFIQEYLDNLSKMAILEKNTNLGDYGSMFLDPDILEDALYSAAVGVASGGAIEGTSPNSIDSNVRMMETFKEQLEIRAKNTTDKDKISQYENIISNIDEYLKKPFSASEEKTEDTVKTVMDLVEEEKNAKSNDPLANLQTYKETLQQKKNQQLTEETNNKIAAMEKELKDLKLENAKALIPNISTEGMDLQQSGARYGYDMTSEALTTAQRLFSNRGIESRFDGTLPEFKDGSVAAIWSKDADGNRSVILNPNADEKTIVQNLAIHELTHDLMSSANSNDALKPNEIIDYVKTLDGYAEARKALEETYSKNYNPNNANFQSMIDEEVVADVLGKKLGNQEFINRLVYEKPNFAKKVYNWVVDKLNSIVNRGGNIKNEKLYWKSVKNRFEKAYNMDYKNNSTKADTRAMMTGKKGAKNAVNNNINNKFLLDNYNKAIKMDKNGVDPDIIRKKTGWFKDKYGKWKFELSDEDARIIKKPKKNGVYKLSELLEHDDLYELYPKLKDAKVKFMDLADKKTKDGKTYKVRGYFNSLTNTIVLNNDIVNSNEKIMDTILHEVQHRIQKIEGFKGGKSLSGTAEDYAKDFGEKEARETSERKNMPYAERIANKPNSYTDRENTKSLAQKNNKMYNLDEVESNDSENSELLREDILQVPDDRNLRSGKEGQELENSSFSYDSDGRKLSKEQQEYFKDSKARDKEGHLLELYHGSTGGDFTIFDNSYGNVEGDFGKGFYFSNQLSDVEAHYEDGGEDFENKVSRLAERIEQEEEISYDEAKEKARNQLYKGGNRFNVYLNITNPAIVGETRLFNYEDYLEDIEQDLQYEAESYQEEIEDYTKEYFNTENIDNLSEEDIKEARDEYLREQGIYDDIVNKYLEDDIENAVDAVNNNLEIYNPEELRNLLWESVYDGGIEVQELKEKINNQLEISDENGDLANNEAVRLMLESLGYDGIIDNTVSSKFKNMGLDEDTTHYIAFNSNQIKNIDNTNPTSNEDIRMSKESKDWDEWVNKNFKNEGTTTKLGDIKLPSKKQVNLPTKQEVKATPKQELNLPKNPTKESTYDSNEETSTEKLAEILDSKPETEEQKEKRVKTLLTTKILDKGYYVDKVARKYKNKELSAKYDYQMLANGIGNQIIGNGRYDSKGNKVGKSLYEIFEPIENAGLVKEFSEYMYHLHNVDRMNLENTHQEDNKPVFGDSVTSEISKQKADELLKKHPEFEEWAEDVYEYSKADLQTLVDKQVISQEAMDYYNKKYPHYVPIVRDNSNIKTNMSTFGKKASINTPIKTAKGGNIDLIPLKDALAYRTMQSTNSALKNDFGLELYKTIYGDDFKGNNEATDNIIESDNEILTPKTKDKNATFTIFKNGEKTTMEIPDEIYEALTPRNLATVKPLNKFNNFRRGILTEYNPTFMITNPIKDIQDGLINSRRPAQFIKNIPEAFMQIVKKGKLYDLYMANGGGQDTYFNYDKGTNINKKLPSKWNIPKRVLNKISDINQVIEMTPRMSEFISSLNAGDSIQTAMYNAQEVTTNFKKGGDWTKTLDRNGFTFLNAGMQGFQKQVRNIQEGGMNGARGIVNLGVKFAVSGLALGVLNDLIWDDDDDYKELSDYIKNNYYIIGKSGDGKFIKIPKGRVSSVLQKFSNNLIDTAKEQKIDVKDWKQFEDLVKNNLLPNDPEENNLLSPLVQAHNNKTWYGSDLVPTRLQNLPNAEQYDESTDNISIFLGKVFNISPYKINYVLDQYSGAIGDYTLPFLTLQAESPSDSVGGQLLAPIADKFTADSVFKNQNVSDIYSLSEEYTTKANGSKATDEDKVKNKYINSKKAEMSKLYAEKRNIQSDKDLSNKEKYEKTREIQKEINKIAKEALETYEDATVVGNYAKVGDIEYYQNYSSDGTKKWTKVKAEEAEDLNNIGFSDEAKNTYFTEKDQVSDIRSNDSLSAAEKKEQISSILTNSSLDDKQLSYLYGKYYSTEEKLNALSSVGMPIKEYIKYDLTDFESDYNPRTGKAITNSKKKKVINYVNGLKLTPAQKALLIKMEYNSFKGYDSQIVNYVESSEADYLDKAYLLKRSGFDNYDREIINYVKQHYNTVNEREEILKNLGFTVRNGRVY